uniref:Uncharacterized protein LOC104217677 n=1 Tax=Nicotiana sylvestris TaxID=4096 RepID=A0A1U7VIZ4_NICSY|nr:PREDICTED: uncharacterized protein LOC104217677 [Nicotiana sylvestris]
MGLAGRDSRLKQENPRYNPRSRGSKAKIGSYNINVSTSQLMVVLRSMGDKVQWPKKMRSNPNRRNPNIWCKFHNDHGHKMADCRLLHGEVENLLKQGYLTELFSEKGKQAYMKDRQEPLKPPSRKRMVNVISGGEKINGITYTTSEKVSKITVTHGKRVRQVLEEDSITFDDANADGMLTPHNDTLVISLLVHDTNVMRLLIDPGSSINIILLRVVSEMQANDKLVPKARTLSGFDNSSSVTKGEIILTKFTERVVKDTKFQVIEMDMAYNMILDSQNGCCSVYPTTSFQVSFTIGNTTNL